MDKKAVFKDLFDQFEVEGMRLYCADMAEQIPDYFFTMPSSTSGKFHNATQCLLHGQVYHAIMFGTIMNYLLSLKCNREKFKSPIQRDAMRCTAILHDAIKCGWDGSQYTVHEHPMLAGQWIRETHVEHDVDDTIKERIACMVERHSGSWTTSKYSTVVLPEPENEMEILVHECDILSSRPDIDMQPPAYLKSIFGEETEELPEIETYTLGFGKMKGLTIPEIAEKDISYLYWAEQNMTSQPAATLIKKYLAERKEN